MGVGQYWVAKGEGYCTLANLFDIAKSSVCAIVHDFCKAVHQVLMPDYIKIPQGDDLQEVLRGFRQRWGFPQCAGVIDGSHIPIIAPEENHTDYFNRKGWHSVLLQGVVDHRCNNERETYMKGMCTVKKYQFIFTQVLHLSTIPVVVSHM